LPRAWPGRIWRRCRSPQKPIRLGRRGGHFVRPVLIRISSDAYTLAYAIRTAVLAGADVISISSYGGCNVYHWVCALPPADIYDMLLQSVRFARSYLVPVVSISGNEGEDIADRDVYPCKTEGVICVGGVSSDKTNVGNYGERIDIWAPWTVRSTTTSDSVAEDNDNFGIDELYLFTGTSTSAPFVAAAVGLMKTANPNLSYEQVLSILQSTANSSQTPEFQRAPSTCIAPCVD
jgi:subtilisin family serine protease